MDEASAHGGTDTTDTICAVATPAGKSGVAIVRCSGPFAIRAAEELTGSSLSPRLLALRKLRDGPGGDVIDQALVAVFPGPASFTGEDMAEFHVHGSGAVLRDLIDLLTDKFGMRAAEPGEFTRRAFANGKLDLLKIEAMADLIEAETTAQRRQALRAYDGALNTVIDAWHDRLLEALALAEASFDFSDEGEISDDVFDRAAVIVRNISASVAKVLHDSRLCERIRNGMSIVIAGPPNAGKSTLLNTLARRDVAIVSDMPGTTRDTLEVQMDLGGMAATVVDTAGLRNARNAIEKEGIARAQRRMEEADLVLLVVDGDAAAATIDGGNCGQSNIWVLRNKIDLHGRLRDHSGERRSFPVSAKTGAGIDALIDALTEEAAHCLSGSEHAVISRSRHRRLIEDVQRHLENFLDARHGLDDARTEDLRAAIRALGSVTGAVDPDQILDRIFSSFCVGK